MVIKTAQGWQKGTRRILCPEYTLNHNQKEKELYTSNPIHLEQGQTNVLRMLVYSEVWSEIQTIVAYIQSL